MTSIFDMCQQTPNVPYRARPGGLGIGLLLVRQLAQLHGGKAEAFSDGEGRGTRFAVSLPADTSFVRRQPGDMPADLSVFRNLRILLVEDPEESLTAMADLLSLYEPHVVSSANGDDALQKASQTQFDLVVTDVGLPDMDGYQLVSALRKLPLCAAIPIAAHGPSGRGGRSARARAGCDACLAKPFTLQALADVVHRLRPGR
ncbi:response regulator [Caballeronia sp. SL2Y3]|uniref:response regulator n=1 Tax=Caballeronia sp. SL2Y3 TaxID=2878151 RepID=UPI001FD437D6|nr:response regulator [Caballeronia sp. SL2Y3]